MMRNRRVLCLFIFVVGLFLISTIPVEGQGFASKNTLMQDNPSIFDKEINWLYADLPVGAIVYNNLEDYIDQLSDLHPESDIGTHSNIFTLRTLDGVYDVLTSDNITVPEQLIEDPLTNISYIRPAYESWRLDLEGGWIDIDHDEVNAELCIYGGMQASESLKVDIWSDGNWVNVIMNVVIGWNNVSISSSLKDNTLEMRFKNINTGNTSVQNSWEIDAILLHTWTTVYSSEYSENGLIERVGDALLRYSVSIGEMNIYNEINGTWHRYLYDEATRTVKIGGLTITHLVGGALSIDGDAGSKIGRLSWYIQAYYAGVWQNITLSNYEFVGFTKTTNNITAHQRFWDVQGEMDIYITYSYFGGFKTRVDITNDAVTDLPIRAIWAAQDVSGIQNNYELLYDENEVLYGIQVEDAVFGWGDVIASDNPLPIETAIDIPNRRAAVIFGNQSSIISSGYTASIDPDYTMTSDAYDNYWDYWDDPTDTDVDNANENKIDTDSASYTYGSIFAAPVTIEPYSIITAATLSVYQSAFSGEATVQINRIDAATVSALDDNVNGNGGAPPSVAGTPTGSIELDAVGTRTSSDIAELVQHTINEAGWASGNYIGFRLLPTDTCAHTIEDYQDATSNHAKISITFVAASTNWLLGYEYRQGHGIDGKTGATTNYPIKLLVEYGAGTSDAGIIYCNSKSQTDFDDIRFTDNDGETELNYWMEEKTDNDDATFWVNVTDDLSSDQVIYVYYGNTGVSTTSNGTATFTWFDDFESNGLGNWSAPGAAWSVQGATVKYGSYSALGVGQATGRTLTEDMADITTSVRIRTWVRSTGVTQYMIPHYPNTVTPSASSIYAVTMNGNEAGDQFKYYNGTAYFQWGAFSYIANTWYLIEWAWDATNNKMYCIKDGTFSQVAWAVNAGGATFTDVTKLNVLAASSTENMYIDDYIIRKWVVSEPVSYTWSNEETVTPVNDQTPVCTNLDDTDNLYAYYKEYIFTSNVSTPAGYVAVDYVELSLVNVETPLWTVRFDEDTEIFSESLDTNNYITLEATSSNISSGNTLNITWQITIHWNHTDVTDYDLNQTVISSSGNVDTDTYAAIDYDVETRVTLTGTLSDGSGTTDRGNYDSIGTITASGTVIYYNSVDDNPPDTSLDIYVTCADLPTPTRGDTTLVSGAYSLVVDSDDIVGLDTYWFYAVIHDAGSGGTKENATSISDTYIADRVQVQSYIVTGGDTRINTGSSTAITVYLDYDYDNTDVTDGTVTINGLGTTYVGSGNGWFTANQQETIVTANIYDTVAVSGNTHGITAEDQNGQSVTVIWDEVKVIGYTTNSTDNHDNIGIYVNVSVWLQFDYDDANMTDDGDTIVKINGQTFTYDGVSNWTAVFMNATHSTAVWNDVQTTGNLYSITVENQNGKSVTYVWDSLTITFVGPTDNRQNLNANATGIVVSAVYDEGGTYDGTLTLNDTDYNGDGIVEIAYFTVSAANGDDTYGITAIGTNDNTYMIWDQIIIRGYVANDTRTNINQYVNVSIWIQYDYDDSNVTDGTVVINGDSFSYLAGWNWTAVFVNATVNDVIWNTVVATGNTYDITDVNQNSKDITVIWDALTAYVSPPSDQRNNINTNATGMVIWAIYEYDSTSYDGTLQLNDTTYNYGTVGRRGYNITVANGDDTYGITVISNNGNQTYCIWDALTAYVSPPTDQRNNINTNATGMIIWAIYEYDSTSYDGTIQLNNTDYNYESAQRQSYNVTVANGDDTYGITIISNNGNQTYCIWDSLTCYVSPPNDQRQNLNANATGMIIWAIYDYDNTAYNGGLTLNNTDYNGDGTVVRWDYNVTIADGLDTYGITVIMNTGNQTYMIWDSVYVSAVTYSGVGWAQYWASWDVAWKYMRFTVKLSYDDHTLAGPADSVEFNTTSPYDNTYVYRWTWPNGFGNFSYIITSASEATYGITAVDDDELWGWLIWEGIEILSVSQDDGRLDINAMNNYTWQARLLSNGTLLDGDNTVFGYSIVNLYDIDNDAYEGNVYPNGTNYIIANHTYASVAKLNYTLGIAIYTSDGDFIVGIYPDLAGFELYNGTQFIQTVWDQIEVYSDGYDYAFARANVGQNVTLWANARLQYDNHELGTGDTIHFGDEIMTWNVGNNRFEASYTRWSVANWVFTLNATGSNEVTYGITVGVNNPVNLVFDRVLIYNMWVNDTYVSLGDDVEVWASLVSEFDNESMQAGLVQLNGTLGSISSGNINMTFSTMSNWYNVTTLPTFGNWTFEITWVNWTTYNITEINYNGWNVTYLWVWAERLIVMGYVSNSTDNRDNINTVVNISIWLQYESDSTNVTDGDVWINGEALTYLAGWNWTALFQNATASDATWNMVTASGNTRGITTVNQNGKSITYVWDSYTVVITIGDNRITISANATIGFTVLSDYDSLAYDGTTILNDTTYDHGVVNVYYYTLVALTGDDTYAITSMTNDADYMIFDAIGYILWTDGYRVNIIDARTVYAWLSYLYDRTNVTDGSVELNGSAMAHVSGGTWSASVSESTIGIYEYNITSISGNTYGITEIAYLEFDGIDDYAYGLAFTMDTNSISFWIYLTTTSSEVIFGNNVRTTYITIDINTSPTKDVLGFKDNNGNSANINLNTNINASEWILVTLVYKLTYDLYIYINGEYDTVNTATFDEEAAFNRIGVDSSANYGAFILGSIWITSNGDIPTTVQVFELYCTGQISGMTSIYWLDATSIDVESATWYDKTDAGNVDISDVGNGVYDCTSDANPIYNHIIFDRINVIVAVNTTWIITTYYYANVSFTGTYEYDSAVWTGNATIANTSLTTSDTVHWEEVVFASADNYTFYVIAVEDTAGYDLTAFTTNTVWCIWDNITGDVYYYFVYQTPTTSLFNIILSNITWVYNGSYISSDWILASYHNTTWFGNSTGTGTFIMTPGFHIATVSATDDAVTYTSNAIATVAGIDYNFQWYEVEATPQAVEDWTDIYLYGPNGIGLDPLMFQIFINDGTEHRISSYQPEWYGPVGETVNITILNFLNETVYTNTAVTVPAQRYINIQIDVYTLTIYSQLDEEFIYFNLTSSGGAIWSEHIAPRHTAKIAIYVSTSYTYAFTVLTGGKGGTFSGTINIDYDYGLIVSGVNLVDIWRGIEEIDPTGSGRVEEIANAIAFVMTGPLASIQFLIWIVIGLMVIGIYVVPFYRKGKEEQPRSRTTESYMKTEEIISKERRKPMPKQLKKHAFKEGPLNPKYEGRDILGEMGDDIWKKLKGEK